MQITRRGLVAIGFAALLPLSLPALAEPIEDTHNRVIANEAPPWLIAIPKFVTDDLDDDSAAHEIAQIVSGDLRSSRLFAPIDASGYIETIVTVDIAPRFADWRAINAQALLTGRVSRRSDNLIAVEALLWDTAAERQLMNERYLAADQQRVGHLISADILDRVRST